MSDGPRQSKRKFRERPWLRAALGLGSALLTQELASEWGRHLPPTDLYPLALAIGMSVYNAHIFHVRPAMAIEASRALVPEQTPRYRRTASC